VRKLNQKKKIVLCSLSLFSRQAKQGAKPKTIEEEEEEEGRGLPEEIPPGQSDA
jgi:hypothetical protein